MPTSTAATMMRASSPGARPVELDGHAQRAARPHHGRQAHVDREACAPCGRPRTTARRSRGRACGSRARRADGAASPPHRRPCPSPCRPSAGCCAVPACHVDGLGRQQLVADHVERDLAGGARRDRNRHRVAGLIFGLVERDLEQVRRVGRRVRIEAGIEGDRGLRNARVLAGRRRGGSGPIARAARCGPACRRRRRRGRRATRAWS